MQSVEDKVKDEIKEQQHTLAQAQHKAETHQAASHSPATILGVVKALNRLTAAVLTVASVIDKAAQESWDEKNLEDERRAR